MAMKYHCEPCNKDFSSNHRLQRHLESTSAHQQAKHECHICHKFYMSKAGLAQHIKINHEKIKPKRRQCPLCEKSFCDGKGLKSHLESVHKQGEKSHKCEFCGLTFMYITDKKNHVKIVHMNQRDKPCQFCSYGSASNQGLDKHLSRCVHPQTWRVGRTLGIALHPIQFFALHVSNIDQVFLVISFCS